jgi:hypothetical protein
MTPMDSSEFFFTAPTIAPAKHQQDDAAQSVPYLLRREAQDCLLGTVIDESLVRDHAGDKHRVFATTMVLLSGIDLLGRFLDPRANVEQRFKRFVRTYMYPDEPDAADALYAVRNAIMHAFGLHDAVRALSLVLDQTKANTIQAAAVTTAGNRAVVNVLQLFDDVIRAITRYRRDLLDADTRHNEKRRNFEAMFP